MAEMGKKAARFIADHRQALIEEWEEASKGQIGASRGAEKLALRDQVPDLLDSVQATLQRVAEGCEARSAASESLASRISGQHGEQRASTKGYTLGQTINEFILFRHVLSDSLIANDLASTEALQAIDHIVDLTMLASANAYMDALQQVRERVMGTLAHDMREPLSIAFTSFDIVAEKKLSPEEAAEFLKIGRREIKRSLGMLSDLLDSVSVEAGEGMAMRFGEHDYSAEIRDTCAEISRFHGDRIQVSVPDQSIPAVFCPGSIRRVVENLVSNALKHGSEKGVISIQLVDRGDAVELSVHNEGVPIPDEQKDRIFDFLNEGAPKERRSETGWGIGLALVKLVAEAHKGEVRVSSAEGEGTVFAVRLHKRPHPAGHTRARRKGGQ